MLSIPVNQNKRVVNASFQRVDLSDRPLTDSAHIAVVKQCVNLAKDQCLYGESVRVWQYNTIHGYVIEFEIYNRFVNSSKAPSNLLSINEKLNKNPVIRHTSLGYSTFAVHLKFTRSDCHAPNWTEDNKTLLNYNF